MAVVEGYLKVEGKWLYCVLAEDTSLACYTDDTLAEQAKLIKTNEAAIEVADMDITLSVNNAKTGKMVPTTFKAANVLELQNWQKKINDTLKKAAERVKADAAMAAAQDEAAKRLKKVEIAGVAAAPPPLAAPTLADVAPPAATKPLHVQHGKPSTAAGDDVEQMHTGWLKRVTSPAEQSANSFWIYVVLYADGAMVEYTSMLIGPPRRS